jgi:uncharacterized protein
MEGEPDVRDGFPVLDSDIHVIEPRGLWEQYLDPAYRRPGADGCPGAQRAWMLVGDRPVPAGADTPARQRALALRYGSPRCGRSFAQRGEDELRELAKGTTPGGMLRAMDVEGIDVSVVFRTQAAHVIAFDDQDPALSAALCRAFNRWLADFCATDPDRLKAGALVPLQDPGLAVEEAGVAVEELGALTLVLPSHMVCERPLYHPDLDPLWALAQDLGVAVSFHGIQASYTAGMLANRYPESPVLGHASGHGVEMMLALGAVLTGGVAARHPGLRFAFLEGGCGWLPWWLWALDERWEKWGDRETFGQDELPSELFARQCYISTEVDEPMLDDVVRHVGDDNVVVSTDWPHDDSAYPHAVETFLGLDAVGPDTKRKVLWDNCARLYGL